MNPAVLLPGAVIPTLSRLLDVSAQRRLVDGWKDPEVSLTALEQRFRISSRDAEILTNFLGPKGEAGADLALVEAGPDGGDQEEAAGASGGEGGPMKERPMLFSAPMVLALLAGAKTQTRRIVKNAPLEWLDRDGFTPAFVADPDNFLSPYGFAGDRLWVRETLRMAKDRSWNYGADGAPVLLTVTDERVPQMISWAHHKDGDTCVSIHMPRWASRITLEVTGVRIERLQDISEADAIAEGISEVSFIPDDGFPRCLGYMVGKNDGKTPLETSARGAYRLLWESINGAGSWAANPWVWAIAFRRLP